MYDPAISIVHMTCPHCGGMELRPSALHVTTYVGVGAYHVLFFCPHCADEVHSQLTPEAADFLVQQMGVGYEEHHVPAEFLEDKSGPPISSDDVLDFALAMRQIVPRYVDDDLPEELHAL